MKKVLFNQHLDINDKLENYYIERKRMDNIFNYSYSPDRKKNAIKKLNTKFIESF